MDFEAFKKKYDRKEKDKKWAYDIERIEKLNAMLEKNISNLESIKKYYEKNSNKFYENLINDYNKRIKTIREHIEDIKNRIHSYHPSYK